MKRASPPLRLLLVKCTAMRNSKPFVTFTNKLDGATTRSASRSFEAKSSTNFKSDSMDSLNRNESNPNTTGASDLSTFLVDTPKLQVFLCPRPCPHSNLRLESLNLRTRLQKWLHWLSITLINSPLLVSRATLF